MLNRILWNYGLPFQGGSNFARVTKYQITLDFYGQIEIEATGKTSNNSKSLMQQPFSLAELVMHSQQA